ncbi:MAG: hypothetical protein V3571_07470 [Pseudodesulfovibrio sp.]
MHARFLLLLLFLSLAGCNAVSSGSGARSVAADEPPAAQAPGPAEHPFLPYAKKNLAGEVVHESRGLLVVSYSKEAGFIFGSDSLKAQDRESLHILENYAAAHPGSGKCVRLEEEQCQRGTMGKDRYTPDPAVMASVVPATFQDNARIRDGAYVYRLGDDVAYVYSIKVRWKNASEVAGLNYMAYVIDLGVFPDFAKRMEADLESKRQMGLRACEEADRALIESRKAQEKADAAREAKRRQRLEAVREYNRAHFSEDKLLSDFLTSEIKSPYKFMGIISRKDTARYRAELTVSIEESQLVGFRYDRMIKMELPVSQSLIHQYLIRVGLDGKGDLQVFEQVPLN